MYPGLAEKVSFLKLVKIELLFALSHIYWQVADRFL